MLELLVFGKQRCIFAIFTLLRRIFAVELDVSRLPMIIYGKTLLKIDELAYLYFDHLIHASHGVYYIPYSASSLLF